MDLDCYNEYPSNEREREVKGLCETFVQESTKEKEGRGRGQKTKEKEKKRKENDPKEKKLL